MVEKKAYEKKKLIKKTSSEKSTKISTKTKKTAKGTKYACKICGLIVSIDRECGCIETCDIICCGQQMVQKK